MKHDEIYRVTTRDTKVQHEGKLGIQITIEIKLTSNKYHVMIYNVDADREKAFVRRSQDSDVIYMNNGSLRCPGETSQPLTVDTAC